MVIAGSTIDDCNKNNVYVIKSFINKLAALELFGSLFDYFEINSKLILSSGLMISPLKT